MPSSVAATLLLAHEEGGLGDSGLSPSLVLYVSVAMLVLVAVALRSTWTTARFGPMGTAEGAEDGTGPVGDRRASGPIRSDRDRWIESDRDPQVGSGRDRQVSGLVIAGRALALAVFSLLLLIGFTGSPTPGANLVPVAVFSAFWYGGLLLSVLVGDVWSAVNPAVTVVETIGRILDRELGSESPSSSASTSSVTATDASVGTGRRPSGPSQSSPNPSSPNPSSPNPSGPSQSSPNPSGPSQSSPNPSSPNPSSPSPFGRRPRRVAGDASPAPRPDGIGAAGALVDLTPDPSPETDPDTDPDIDADADTNADIDADADSHTDADADADSDVTWWVPAGLLVGFAVLWICWPGGVRPRPTTTFLVVWLAVLVGGGVRHGPAWVRRHDPFTVLFSTVAACSPLRWVRGRPSVMSPVRRLSSRTGEMTDGTDLVAAVLAVALGATIFDGVRVTRTWTDLVGSPSLTSLGVMNTVGLVWIVLTVVAAWMLVARAMDRAAGGDDPLPIAVALAPALAVVVAADRLAHGLERFLLAVQNLVSLASDPFANGADLLGTVDWIDQPILSATALAWVGLILLLAGHLVALIALHDRSVARFGATVAARTVWPVTAFLVASLVIALRLFGL